MRSNISAFKSLQRAPSTGFEPATLGLGPQCSIRAELQAHALVKHCLILKISTSRILYAGERIRTSESTKETALEAVAFDHFATPAWQYTLDSSFKSFSFVMDNCMG